MKKIAMMLLFAFLFASPVMAEEIDFSSMDLETILSLHQKMDEAIRQLTDCCLDDEGMYVGTYLVGKDIQQGRYLLTVTSDGYFSCHLFADKEHWENYDGGRQESASRGETISLSLEDGMVLSVDFGSASVKMASKPSWAP